MPKRSPLTSDVLDHFLDVVVFQLHATVGVDAMLSTLVDGECPPDAIAVTLDFRGDVRGPMTWVFPENVALELVRRLMADPEPARELAIDGASELANILTGHASAVLQAHGFRCEFGSPRVHTGALPAGVSVHLTSDDGPIELVLSLARPTSALPIIRDAGPIA